MPEYTMESGGKSYTFSSDSPLSDSDLQAAAAQYFGPEQSTMGKIGNIISEEAGKLPGKIKSDLSGIANTIMNPKMGDVLPFTLGPGGGAASGLGQGIARGLARSTATGVGRALDAPQGHKIEEGVKGGAMALAWEAALGALPYLKVPYMTKSLNDIAEPLREREAAFASASKAPMEAYNKLKASVPAGAWMQVPSISPTPITFEEASRGLSKLRGVDWAAARNEIFSELQKGGPSSLLTGPALNPPVKASVALGGQTPQAPYAAEGFKIRVPEARFTPPSSETERFATGAIGALQSPVIRTAADVVATERGPSGYPLGAWPGILFGGSLKHLANKIMPGGR